MTTDPFRFSISVSVSMKRNSTRFSSASGRQESRQRTVAEILGKPLLAPFLHSNGSLSAEDLGRARRQVVVRTEHHLPRVDPSTPSLPGPRPTRLHERHSSVPRPSWLYERSHRGTRRAAASQTVAPAVAQVIARVMLRAYAGPFLCWTGSLGRGATSWWGRRPGRGC